MNGEQIVIPEEFGSSGTCPKDPISEEYYDPRYVEISQSIFGHAQIMKDN